MGRARANRNAALLSTTSDEAARSDVVDLLTITLASSPIVLGVVEGLAGAADGIARIGGAALSEDPAVASGSPPSAARRWPRRPV